MADKARQLRKNLVNKNKLTKTQTVIVSESETKSKFNVRKAILKKASFRKSKVKPISKSAIVDVETDPLTFLDQKREELSIQVIPKIEDPIEFLNIVEETVIEPEKIKENQEMRATLRATKKLNKKKKENKEKEKIDINDINRNTSETVRILLNNVQKLKEALQRKKEGRDIEVHNEQTEEGLDLPELNAERKKKLSSRLQLAKKKLDISFGLRFLKFAFGGNQNFSDNSTLGELSNVLKSKEEQIQKDDLSSIFKLASKGKKFNIAELFLRGKKRKNKTQQEENQDNKTHTEQEQVATT